MLCGQLLVVGLGASELSSDERRALARGARGGVVLFRRNVISGAEGPRRLAALVRSIQCVCPPELPPLVAIDQEGGRVVRIGPPALALPPMRSIGDFGDIDFASRLANAQASELAALGLTMSFAPVADIHTRPENPIIGDRAFAENPDTVTKFARAWAEGLSRGGLLSCLKHFPGHGDTTLDSHLALPMVERSREELDRIELTPFRELARDSSVASMMTAHVVYAALDSKPATLSRAICTDLLRGSFGFGGVLFSDDLEMKAIHLPIGEAAVLAIAAGCDALLVCSREDLAEQAHAALVREVERSPAFRSRCEAAGARFLEMRRRVPPRPVDDETLPRVFESSQPMAKELRTRLERGGIS